jgi:hypothetical protein
MNKLIEITPEIAKFRTSTPWREKLAELLEDPVMQEALKAVLSLSAPRDIPAHVPGVHHDTTIAHQFYNMFGVGKAVNMLHFLTTDGGPSGGSTGPEEAPFEHNIPKDLREKPADLKA